MSSRVFFELFNQIESYEDCPTGVNLLVWDGCDYHIEWVDVCADTGHFFPSNGIDFIAYIELPTQDDSMVNLGGGC